MASETASLWNSKFSAEVIDALSSSFDESAIWDSTLKAAEAFWAASHQAHSPIEREPIWAWHLLVLSVGNFKRQAPITLPRLTQHHDSGGIARSPQVKVPVGEAKTITLKVDDPVTWEALCGAQGGIPGISVATASTLLSALWPGDHVIIDIRDINAARGLAYADAVAHELVKEGGLQGDPVSWTAYKWLRPKVLAKAAETVRHPVDVERALFILADRANRAQVAAYMKRHGLTKKNEVPDDLPWDGNDGYQSFIRSEMVAARNDYEARQSSSSQSRESL